MMAMLPPMAPLFGFRLVMVGGANGVKLPLLMAVCPPTVTEIVPALAFVGTVTVKLVVVAAVTVAGMLLKKRTLLLAGMVLNPVPVRVMLAPMAALVGVKPVIVGETVKLETLVAS
jgi:hypothetical protein